MTEAAAPEMPEQPNFFYDLIAENLAAAAQKIQASADKVPDAQVGRHARKAAEIMEERGWAKGMYEKGTGEVCAMGAFHRAVQPMKLLQRTRMARAFNVKFAKFLKANYSGDVENVEDLGDVPYWNDQILGADTLQWLRKFADAADPKRV